MAAMMVAVAPAALAAPCAGFTDVEDGGGFCPNVEWMKNGRSRWAARRRRCTARNAVGRLPMAAFMNRLGTALTPVQFPVDVAPGAIDLDAGLVVCQTQDFAVEGFPRRAYVDLSFSGNATGGCRAGGRRRDERERRSELDQPQYGRQSGFGGGEPVGQLADVGFADLSVGQSVRFGVRMTRGGIARDGGSFRQPLPAAGAGLQP